LLQALVYVRQPLLRRRTPQLPPELLGMIFDEVVLTRGTAIEKAHEDLFNLRRVSKDWDAVAGPLHRSYAVPKISYTWGTLSQHYRALQHAPQAAAIQHLHIWTA
jgi:hypothetical protein